MNYPNTQLLIAGQRDAPTAARFRFTTLPPAPRSVAWPAPIADLDRALEAAQKGFEAWRDMPALERQKIMRRAAGLMHYCERAEASPPLRPGAGQESPRRARINPGRSRHHRLVRRRGHAGVWPYHAVPQPPASW